MITLNRFRRLEADLRVVGHGPTLDWSEKIEPPLDADEFASRTIYVICNSGMKYTVAWAIFERCMLALRNGRSATHVFGHPKKALAIDGIWAERVRLFDDFQSALSKLEFLAEIPWIGPVTKHHLAKNLGYDTAKPDVHLERLAHRDRTTVPTLCKRLARLTGYRIATIDSVLWRACADGILSSRAYEADGWKAAYRGLRPDSPSKFDTK